MKPNRHAMTLAARIATAPYLPIRTRRAGARSGILCGCPAFDREGEIGY
jgi:hypothetical protein